MVVLGDGEHHNDNATDATRDFLGDRDRIHSLRLHPHAETEKKLKKLARRIVANIAKLPELLRGD